MRVRYGCLVAYVAAEVLVWGLGSALLAAPLSLEWSHERGRTAHAEIKQLSVWDGKQARLVWGQRAQTAPVFLEAGLRHQSAQPSDALAWSAVLEWNWAQPDFVQRVPWQLAQGFALGLRVERYENTLLLWKPGIWIDFALAKPGAAIRSGIFMVQTQNQSGVAWHLDWSTPFWKEWLRVAGYLHVHQPVSTGAAFSSGHSLQVRFQEELQVMHHNWWMGFFHRVWLAKHGVAGVDEKVSGIRVSYHF
ncbi:MAG: hypothetical protein OXT67_13790 [Zetaproteobacteria bacterium]|nr:hypothetical protein [Zetaproteobacteria bacterium]